MNVDEKYLPPIADPSIWQFFIDSTTDTNRLHSARQYRDVWHVNELLGDKSMAFIALLLFKKYDIAHSWCSVMISTILANEYQKSMSKALGLPRQILSGSIGKKGSADILEVITISISPLINWRILWLSKKILCIYSPYSPGKIISSTSWKMHGDHFWFTSMSFIVSPFAWTGYHQWNLLLLCQEQK